MPGLPRKQLMIYDINAGIFIIQGSYHYKGLTAHSLK